MTRKLALLIGNGNYGQVKEYSSLKKSVADVENLAEPLRDPSIGDFEDVQLLPNEPIDVIQQAIERFFQQGKKNDLLLLYLTGHGDIDRRSKWYFICNETKPDLLSSTAISASFIKEVMDQCQSICQIVIIDTCYAGAFAEGAKGTVDIAKSLPEQLTSPARGRAILVAATSTQRAWEGDEQTPNSTFTHYLVKGLKTGEADTNTKGVITVDEWFEYASTRVKSERANQTPRKYIERQEGAIIIAQNPSWKTTEGIPNQSALTIQPKKKKPLTKKRIVAISLLIPLLMATVLGIFKLYPSQNPASSAYDNAVATQGFNLVLMQPIPTLILMNTSSLKRM